MNKKYLAIITVVILLCCASDAKCISLIDSVNPELLNAVQTPVPSQNTQTIQTQGTNSNNTQNPPSQQKEQQTMNQQTPQNNDIQTPVLTSNMSVDEKKQAITDLMKKYGYDNYDIKRTTQNIELGNVTDDLAPSFYTALKNGYLEKYINSGILHKYFYDENKMAKIVKLVEDMKKYGYYKNDIMHTAQNIKWENSTDNLSPSFYIALKNGYLEKNISGTYLGKYFSDENNMSKIVKLTEKMKKYGYHDNGIKETTKNIKWENVTHDFSPSFYTALEKGYLYEKINSYYLGKYFTDEDTMSKIIKVLDANKNTYVDHKKWEYITEEYVNNCIKYQIFSVVKEQYYKENPEYKKAIDELMQSSKDEEYKKKSIELYNNYDVKTVSLINNNLDLSFDKKEDVLRYVQKSNKIMNNNNLTDQEKALQLQKLAETNYKRTKALKKAGCIVAAPVIAVVAVATAPIWIPLGIWFLNELGKAPHY